MRFTYRVTTATTLPPRLRVAFPAEWAGHDDLDADIRGIRVVDADGAPLDATLGLDGVLAISPGSASTVALAYTVRPSERLLTHATRFRAVFGADRFFAPGLALLAQPLDLGTQLAEHVVFTSDTTDPAWALRATVDLDEPLSMRDLADAAFFAGEFDRVDRARDGRTVAVWVEERLSTRPHALADLALSVIEAQAALLGDDDARRTTVVVLRRDDDPQAVNGTGRVGGFVLELGDDVDIDRDGVTELVAHENFHRLNGHRLRYAAVDEYATMWFREGVTDYVSRRNAAAHGVLPAQRFFRFVGLALANYYGSPVSGAVAAQIGGGFWADRDLRRLPYDKGALLGMLIDLELRADGTGDIESFVRFIAERTDERSALLTNTTIREALEAYTGRDWQEFFGDYVLGVEPLPVFERLNAAGLAVVERVEPAPYFGFRTSVTVDGEWFVSRVEAGSPADAAGVHEGMRLNGEPYVPTHPHGGEAVLDVTTDRGSRRLSVRSGRGQRRTFALTAEDDSYLDAFGLQ